MSLPKIDMTELARLRNLRAGRSAEIADLELRIVQAQSSRHAALERLALYDDHTRKELRDAGVPEAECTLHHADRLVDAYLEGRTAIKLGSFEPVEITPAPKYVGVVNTGPLETVTL